MLTLAGVNPRLAGRVVQSERFSERAAKAVYVGGGAHAGAGSVSTCARSRARCPGARATAEAVTGCLSTSVRLFIDSQKLVCMSALT